MRHAVAVVLAVLGGILGACGSFGDAAPSPDGPDADASTSTGETGPDGGVEIGAEGGVDGGDAGSVPPDPTLLAHWKMDESSGTVVADSIGGRDGLVNGDGKFVPGKLGNAFSTEFGNSHVIVANTATLEVTNELTIAMWISLQASSNDSFFYAHAHQFSMKLNGRRPQLYVGSFYMNVDYEVPANTWHHVAATFASGVAKIYVDGVDAGERESNASVASAPPMTGSIKIGTSNDGSSPALGFIDDVRFWKRVLTAAEVKDLAQPK